MTDPNAPVLEGRGISVRFGGLRALDKVDVAIEEGCITGLVGPNGAGKTTLFGVLSGLLRPTEGEVFMDGHDVTSSSPQARAQRGMSRTFQRLELFGELTVRENLVLGYRSRHRRHRFLADMLGISRRMQDSEENAVVDELLTRLNLTNVAQRAAASLPLGYGRLVELGRALASAPRVLLLDEPSSGLDTSETEQFEEVLVETCSKHGVSLLLVEHNLQLVLGICKTVYVLDFGQMIAAGSPDDIRKDSRVQAAYVGSEASV